MHQYDKKLQLRQDYSNNIIDKAAEVGTIISVTLRLYNLLNKEEKR